MPSLESLGPRVYAHQVQQGDLILLHRTRLREWSVRAASYRYDGAVDFHGPVIVLQKNFLWSRILDVGGDVYEVTLDGSTIHLVQSIEVCVG